MTNNKGGAAFLVPGMTLRDYFAAKAMHGILSGPELQLKDMRLLASLDREKFDIVIARFSYEQADAMIKARGEGND